MAVKTFGDLWRHVALHVPMAPVGLVQTWCQDRYNDLLGKRHWSFLRKDLVLTTGASRTITATFTQGSPIVTSSTNAFLATDVGRQLRTASQSTIYTIATFVNAGQVTLVNNFYEPSVTSVTTDLRDRYLVMPADFRSFHTVTDMTIMRPIAWWISKDRLDLFDPGRIASDVRFRVLAAQSLSQVPTTVGQIQYEAWPPPTAVGSYQVQYFQRTDDLTDDTLFQGPLATWTHALQQGALADAAKWPGTPSQKNPYFNLALANKLDGEFLVLLKSMDVMDDDTYLMDLQGTDLSKFGLAALSADTTLMRQSDATLADYY